MCRFNVSVIEDIHVLLCRFIGFSDMFLCDFINSVWRHVCVDLLTSLLCVGSLSVLDALKHNSLLCI